MLFYLASPFTHDDVQIRNLRTEQVAEVAAYLMQAGLFVFAPIPHGVLISKYGLPDGYEEFWKPYCHTTLGRCDSLIVLKLDGWEESTGVQDEILIARQLGKPIYYIEHRDEAYVKDFAQKLIEIGA